MLARFSSHFRPRTPTEDPNMLPPPHECLSPSLSVTEFNVESFQSHQEQLLLMQREQQEELLKQEATDLEIPIDLDHSFSSQPTSRFTLDSATARFAASAVCNSAQDLITSSEGASSLTRPSGLQNGQSDSKCLNVWCHSVCLHVVTVTCKHVTLCDAVFSWCLRLLACRRAHSRFCIALLAKTC